MRSHAFLPHTADIVVHAVGDSASELLVAALDGVCELLNERPPAPSAPERQLAVHAPDLHSLVVAALNELIASSAGDAIGWCSAVVDRTVDGYVATVTFRAEPYARDRHGERHEIKAATYHDPNMPGNNQEPGGDYSINILLDI